MKSKTSFFNFGLFKNSIRRFWPMWSLYTGLGLLLLISIISDNFADNSALRAISLFNDLSGAGGVIIAFFAAIIIAAAMFSFLYGSKTSGLISSLPVKREGVFISAYLAGVIPFVLINCVIALMCIISVTGCGKATDYGINAILTWLAVYDMAFIAFYGLAVFCAFLTGHIIAMIVLYGIFSVLTVGIEMLVSSVAQIFIYGLSDAFINIESANTLILSPLMCLCSCCRSCIISVSERLYYMSFEGWTYVTAWCIAGIVLSVISLFMYRKRRMECTGDVIAIPALRPVFKYCVSACFAMAIGIMIFVIFTGDMEAVGIFGAVFFFVCMAIGAFIGYFGSEMLLDKSLHVFKGRWKGFLVLSALCAVFVMSFHFDIFKIGAYSPDPEDVVSVSFDDALLKDKDNIKSAIEIQKFIVENKDKYVYRYEGDDEVNSAWINISYKLENGRSINRSYAIVAEDNPVINKCNELLNCDEAVRYRTFSDIDISENSFLGGNIGYFDEKIGEYTDISLDSEECFDLYVNGLQKDLADGTFGYIDASIGDMFADDFITGISLMLTGDGKEHEGTHVYNYYDEGLNRLQLDVPINSNMKNTLQWLKENKGADLLKSFTAELEN